MVVLICHYLEWYCKWAILVKIFMLVKAIIKPPLHRTVTLVPPLCDHKNGYDAHWSLEPRKFCFCVTAPARPLCLPWTTKAAVVPQHVAQRRQSEGRTIATVAQVLPWSLNGGTVVATVIAQWTPLVGQRRHSGGTRKAGVSLKFETQCSHFYWAINGRPLCIHSATTAMCVPSFCLLWATCERPTSSATFVRLLWTCFKTSTTTMASMAMSERPLCHPWTTKATVLPPLCLQRRPDQFCGRTREAQGSQPLCKGVISARWDR